MQGKLNSNPESQGFKEQYLNEGPVSPEKQEQMSKEDTEKFYVENLPFLRLQDEFEELSYKVKERQVRTLELQVRELDAIGYLSQWKAGQDAARERAENEKRAQAEWDAMSPEEREVLTKEAQNNYAEMESQLKAEQK